MSHLYGLYNKFHVMQKQTFCLLWLYVCLPPWTNKWQISFQGWELYAKNNFRLSFTPYKGFVFCVANFYFRLSFEMSHSSLTSRQKPLITTFLVNCLPRSLIAIFSANFLPMSVIATSCHITFQFLHATNFYIFITVPYILPWQGSLFQKKKHVRYCMMTFYFHLSFIDVLLLIFFVLFSCAPPSSSGEFWTVCYIFITLPFCLCMPLISTFLLVSYAIGCTGHWLLHYHQHITGGDIIWIKCHWCSMLFRHWNYMGA